MGERKAVVAIVFYLGLTLLMALILLNLLSDVLPSAIAVRVGYNSEGYTAALLLASWIQFVRPRLLGHPWQWPVTLLVGLAFAAVGLLLLQSDLPSRFKTLNEAMFGLAIVIPYVQLRRPVPVRVAVGLAATILVMTVAFNRTESVVLLSETLGLVLLAPLAFDVVDRGILSPPHSTSRRLRYGWYALLVLIPATSSLLYHEQLFGGIVGEALRYQVRLHESFVGILLVELYFAVALGRDGRAAADDGLPTPQTRSPAPAT